MSGFRTYTKLSNLICFQEEEKVYQTSVSNQTENRK